MSPTTPTATIGIIGGSGFYSLFDDPSVHDVETPYGAPSAPVTIGSLGGTSVAFIPRHGLHHEFAPHRVPYRANIAVLASLGVTRVFGPCAVGTLRDDLHPGAFVIPDQLVDLAPGRDRTFFDDDVVRHAEFADPYCPELRTAAVSASRSAGIETHDGGTVVTIPGPRYSTRAESAWYRAAGWDLINMTQCPEAALAREIGLCYCAIAMVTDFDTGGEDGTRPSVSAEAVFAVLSSMVTAASDVLARAIRQVPHLKGCRCTAPTA